MDKYKLNVLDIACLLKSFFRELPEPMISAANLQETFVRCLLSQSQETKVESLLMTCLLLPPLSLNTLAYFLQFLKTVSKHSNQNRMTIQNLSVLWSENLMPVPLDAPNNRLTSHHKVIELLIENSGQIGVVPDRFLKRLEESLSTTPNHSTILQQTATDKKKKKGRRSASLTRVFHGIKKAWNGAIGSSESLDKSGEQFDDPTIATPCINKSSKKRKITENLTSFSAKKKKDVLSAMPQNDLLPKTPHQQKEFKKTRLSLGGKKFGMKHQESNGEPSERRWSLVGPSWKSKKNQVKKLKAEKSKLSPVKSLPNLVEPKIMEENLEKMDVTDDEEYVKIPKSEFEAFKERVSAIETRISQEFNSVKLDSLKNDLDESLILNGLEKVSEKFNKTLQEVESIESQICVDDQLSKRLSRELKITKVMRSPSARKIGSIRRRSKESQRLSRNQSWHLGATSGKIEDPKPSTFYPKSNLRRGRPNTVQTGLRHTPVTPVAPVNSSEASENETWMSADTFFSDPSNDHHDVSTDAEKTTDEIDENVFKTPNARMKSLSVRSAAKQMVIKTPMLPPALPPRRTPSTASKLASPMPFSKTPVLALNKSVLTPAQEFSQGRASIARIRSQNAGMVLQKAKLFDGLGKDGSGKSNSKLYVTRIDVQISSSRPGMENASTPLAGKPLINKTLENVKKCDTPSKKSPRKRNQSQNSSKSPRSPAGVNRRQKFRNTQSPHALKTLKDRSSRIDNNENRFKNKINLLNQELLEICTNSPKAKKFESNSVPEIRKPLVMGQNSPRRILKTPAKKENRTPMKAGHMHLKQSPRHSPRLSTINRKAFKNVY